MTTPTLFDRLRLPVIGSPLFIISGPELVIAQCKAGIVGSFPALNARPQALLTNGCTRSPKSSPRITVRTRIVPPRRSRSTRSSTNRTTG